MSLIAYLQLGNNEIGKYSQEFTVKNVSCKFIRNHNDLRPTEDAYCRSIVVSVFISGKEDSSLFSWYITGESREGRILIHLTDPLKEGEDDVTTLEFSNALCYEMKEEYEIDTKLRVVTLSLAAIETKLDEVEFNG